MPLDPEVSPCVPFFRPSITEAEIAEVTDCLRSGWLTTGPRTRQFETEFAAAVGAEHAIAVSSCTAALHLAVEALRLRAGQAVLVPTLTFAATAEVVHYQRAVPILVDCDPLTLNMDLDDAQRKLDALKSGRSPLGRLNVVGIIPVHVGGLMMDPAAVRSFAARHRLWVVEDAAHAFPAARLQDASLPWRRCGEDTADVTCFSFYTNKTITTGEGGMTVTGDSRLAARIRRMSLHGLSQDSWNRYTSQGAWDYRIVSPGFKYNLTDIAASIGLHQLRRAESMRRQREAIALGYRQGLGHLGELKLPPASPDVVHAWHLFPIRLCLKRLLIDRDAFIGLLRDRGIGCSVHWRPLHLHPYYRKTFNWHASDFPRATAVWKRLVSLPLFPAMQPQEQELVIRVVSQICQEHRVQPSVERLPTNGVSP